MDLQREAKGEKRQKKIHFRQPAPAPVVHEKDKKQGWRAKRSLPSF
jgi:hypothetical protein